jgi:hypothetical protein
MKVWSFFGLCQMRAHAKTDGGWGRRTRCSVSLGPPRATRAMTRRFFGAVRTWVRVESRLLRISCGELDGTRGAGKACLEDLDLDWLGRFVEPGRDYDVCDAGLGFILERGGGAAQLA